MEFRLSHSKIILELHRDQLLFLLYVNDLHNSIRFSSPFDFAADTGLLNLEDKTVNKHFRELSFWLNANKIALNVAKTEIIIFKTNNKNCDADLKIKLYRKRFMHPRKLNISSFLSTKT